MLNAARMKKFHAWQNNFMEEKIEAQIKPKVRKNFNSQIIKRLFLHLF